MQWIGSQRLEEYLGLKVNGRPHFPDLGFVYIINCADQWYIGQKRCYSLRTLPALKGQKKKRKVYRGQWETYTGSSRLLNENIAAGAEYQSTILYVGFSKSELNYVETYLQMITHATHSADSYNMEVNIKGSRYKMRDNWQWHLANAIDELNLLT